MIPLIVLGLIAGGIGALCRVSIANPRTYVPGWFDATTGALGGGIMGYWLSGSLIGLDWLTLIGVAVFCIMGGYVINDIGDSVAYLLPTTRVQRR